MKLKSDILCLAVLSLTGCASLAETSRFALFVPTESIQTAEKTDEDNPFKRREVSTESQDKLADTEEKPATSSEPDVLNLDELDFDEETKQLIVDHLSELPADPKLRAERLEAWKKLNAAEVKQIIHIERLAASVKQQEAGLALGGNVQTVSAQKSPADEVVFVPNSEAGHSGFPSRSPFAQLSQSAPSPLPLANSIVEAPVTLVPAQNPQPQSPLGVALNQSQTQNPAQSTPSMSGHSQENPFLQQSVSLPPNLPPAESVVLVPQQVDNSPQQQAMSNPPGQTPFGPNPLGNMQAMSPAPGQMTPVPQGQMSEGATDPNGNGFVRGLTNAPQSLRNFGAMLTRPFGGQEQEQQQQLPQYANAQPVPQGTVPGNATLNREAMLAQLISITEQELNQLTPEQRHDYVQKNVYLRMLYMMSQQEERSLQYIPGLEPANQEFWQQLFWALSNYFDEQSIPDAQARASQTVAQLHTAAQRLQEQANLELRNVNFCHEINSYGDYKKFPEDEFTPGEGVLIYAEVGNFKSELTSDGLYRTLLKTTIEFYRVGDSGGPVAVETIQPKEDLCRNYRRDFFNGYNLHIPDNLTT
ncbi:MAG: hypothetical protein KDA65_18590, partial [Planctomycetaceae bacterium]|nr:hypothetical protein [Planctomycetaceae bacterium]